jgi:hypothetical protein
MSQPRVAIHLDDSPAAHQPGDALSGEYRVDGAGDHDVRAVELSVMWRTAGQGEEDLGVHFFQRKAAEDEQPLDLTLPFRFETTLPSSPLSYDGVLVKVCWCVRVRVLMAREKDIVAEKEFRLGCVAARGPIGSAKRPATKA